MIKAVQWGEILTGRKLGREVREKALAEFSGEKIVIDFSGVKVAGHSFCDEVFGILALELDNPTTQIKVLNVSDEIKAVIKYVIFQRLQEKTKILN